MTSGLFNTGGTGDSAAAEITSYSPAVQPPVFSKFMGHDLSAETYDPDSLDMNIFGELGAAGFDPLGDASMDSFTDLSALLNQETHFLGQPEDTSEVVAEQPSPFFTAVKTPTTAGTKKPAKRSFAQMEASTTFVEETINFDELQDTTTDLGRLAANVGLKVEKPEPSTPNLDHDYSVKRPRLSEDVVKVENVENNVFFAPSPAPSTASTSYDEPLSVGDKYKSRRDKNNIASKRSREIRKRKHKDMEQEAEHLVGENARLEKRIVDLERLAKQMKEILVAKMAGK